jgi:hypothetical protein
VLTSGVAALVFGTALQPTPIQFTAVDGRAQRKIAWILSTSGLFSRSSGACNG